MTACSDPLWPWPSPLSLLVTASWSSATGICGLHVCVRVCTCVCVSGENVRAAQRESV